MTSGLAPSGSGVTAYTYDARNRLTGVGGDNYGYDAENNRIHQTGPGGTTYFDLDPHGDRLSRVLVRELPDGTITYYVYGLGLAYEVSPAAATERHYHGDHLGSTAALTDASGAVTDRIEYTAYGKTVVRTGATQTPFLYGGLLGVQTDINGFIHMRARYYHPGLMRFLNADPSGFAGGLNWYAYANGSPILFVDPSGFCGEPGDGFVTPTVGGNWNADFVTGAYRKLLNQVQAFKKAGDTGGFQLARADWDVIKRVEYRRVVSFGYRNESLRSMIMGGLLMGLDSELLYTHGSGVKFLFPNGSEADGGDINYMLQGMAWVEQGQGSADAMALGAATNFGHNIIIRGMRASDSMDPVKMIRGTPWIQVGIEYAGQNAVKRP